VRGATQADAAQRIEGALWSDPGEADEDCRPGLASAVVPADRGSRLLDWLLSGREWQKAEVGFSE
jgi:hypothetical protein